MTLGNAAAARVRLIVWCRSCQHQVEPDPAEHARRHGAETSILEWRDKLVCSRCGGREIDMVVSATQRRWSPTYRKLAKLTAHQLPFRSSQPAVS